ncbi:MAG TPA: diguanylate cyclase, partial [Chromatiales bacterium]|nr:diguanylate cyclase [Chromatiales bacterium]
MSPGAKVQAVHVNQNDQLFSRLRYSAVGSAIVATAIVFFVDDSEALPIVAWIWLVMTLFLGLVRIYSAYAYSRDPQAEDDWRKWRSRFRFGTHVSGLLWAFAMWLLFPSGVPTHEVLLILGIAGIGGGAIATLSYDRKTLAIFLGILMAGSVSRLLWAGDELSYQLAFLVTLYFLFLIKGGLDIGSSYVELLQLKEDMKEHNLTLLSTAERVARIGNWQWDMVSETIELSANMARMCGKGSNRVRFDECLQLVHPDDRLRVQAAIDTVISTETEGNVEYRLRRNDDEEWVIMNQIIALHADSNGKKWIMGTVQDISMIKSAEQKIFAMAYYDELTGLANRGHFREYLSKQIKHARRKGSSLALLYIDLDNFKTVNDTLGHAFGDRFLKILADLLRGTLREDDFLARLGGDEFCIIMSDINDGVTPARAAERCLSLSRHAIPLAGKEIPPYMSIGIATFPQDGKNGDTLLRAADTAMYAAKHGG